VADIAFQPVDQPQSFTIDIKPTLVKLHENKLFKPQKPLRLIAVANPLDPKQPMENVEITIGKLSIVVP
jgi:DNA repair photolyase